MLTDFSASHFVDTILCSDRMDDGPADGLELSSLRDCKPLNDGTGCRIFVAGTKIIYRQQFFETPILHLQDLTLLFSLEISRMGLQIA